MFIDVHSMLFLDDDFALHPARPLHRFRSLGRKEAQALAPIASPSLRSQRNRTRFDHASTNSLRDDNDDKDNHDDDEEEEEEVRVRMMNADNVRQYTSLSTVRTPLLAVGRNGNRSGV